MEHEEFRTGGQVGVEARFANPGWCHRRCRKLVIADRSSGSSEQQPAGESFAGYFARRSGMALGHAQSTLAEKKKKHCFNHEYAL